VKDEINLSIKNTEKGQYDIKLYSLTGQIVRSTKYSTSGNEADIRLNVGDLAAGSYLLAVQKDGKRKVMTVVKQ
jgi:hypothetical protein